VVNLSGFILAYSYTTSTNRLRGTCAGFWVARIARIYPVYLLGLALGIVIESQVAKHSLTGTIGLAVTTPLLLQAWIPALVTTNSWDPPSWSLSNEAFFYLLFPAIVVWMARWTSRQLRLAAVVSWLAYCVLPLPLVLFANVHYGVNHWPWWLPQYVLFDNPVMHAPEFVMGVALGLYFLKRVNMASETAATITITRASVVTSQDLLLVALAFIVIVECIFVAPLLPLGFNIAMSADPFIAVMVVTVAHGQGIITRLLGNRWCVWLGEVSYGIYILHWPIWQLFAAFTIHLLHIPTYMPVLFPIYLVVVLLGAGASYTYLERPARRAIRHWWERRTAKERALVAARAVR
jgi:peptidoglycan/LPS O-acetylase OafA/YrhL